MGDISMVRYNYGRIRHPPAPSPTPDSPVVVLLRARLLVESTDAGGPGALVSIEPHTRPLEAWLFTLLTFVFVIRTN